MPRHTIVAKAIFFNPVQHGKYKSLLPDLQSNIEKEGGLFRNICGFVFSSYEFKVNGSAV